MSHPSLNPFCLILLRWGMSKALFIPYALRTHEEYTEKVKKAFHPFGKELYLAKHP